MTDPTAADTSDLLALADKAVRGTIANPYAVIASLAAALRAAEAERAAARICYGRVASGKWCPWTTDEGTHPQWTWLPLTFDDYGRESLDLDREPEPMTDAERAWLASAASTPTTEDTGV